MLYSASAKDPEHVYKLDYDLQKVSESPPAAAAHQQDLLPPKPDQVQVVMRPMLQQLFGLALVLAIADAQDYLTLNDVVIEPRGNWSIDPRGSVTTVACSRRPQVVTLSPGDVATFTSPRYPSQYASRSSCGWKFRTSQQSDEITVTCSSFTLQPSRRGRCRDYLALGRQKYCGSTGPSSVNVDNFLSITFKSDRRSNFAGFSCSATIAGSVVTTADPLDTTAGPVVTTAGPVVTTVGPVVTNAPTGRCVCGTVNRGSRIVGGVTTEVNEYPWQVALVSRGSSGVFCGGSLINDRWVLTAAHCTQSGVSQVLLGNHLQSQTDSAERRINVNRVVDHPNYNDQTLDNDFSLLELASSVDLESVDPEIRPVCLPSANNPSQYEDVPAIISGWGTTSSGGSQPDALRDATVRTMSNAVCNQSYRGAILSSMICASNSNPARDSCQGDSGGPLVRNVGGYYNQIGVVSWGSGCADPNFPGVYSRVTDAITWITSTSSSGSTCAPPS